MIINQVSGGNQLNYRVQGGTILPESGAVNDIFVITATAIGYSIFSPNQPSTRFDGSALASGDVWVKVGTSSAYEFNYIRKDAVISYPICVYLYSGSAWVLTDAYIWQSATWQSLRRWFYNHGTEVTPWTWQARCHVYDSVTLTRNASNLIISGTGPNWATPFICTGLEDLTDLTTLYITYDLSLSTSTRTATPVFTVSSTNPTTWVTAAIGTTTRTGVVVEACPALSQGGASLDVSALEGTYYISLMFQAIPDNIGAPKQLCITEVFGV